MAMGNQGGRFVGLGDVSVSTTLGFLSLFGAILAAWCWAAAEPNLAIRCEGIRPSSGIVFSARGFTA
jgi:hypothetical protein